MTPIAPEQVEELHGLHAEMASAEEAGHSYILLKNLVLPVGCNPVQSDALLCPDSHLGYEARMFFANRITTRQALNWHLEVFILGRTWYAFSWKVGRSDLRLSELIGVFMDAMR
jgi:hypothetical protein